MRRLYVVRFGFAIVWAAVLIVTAPLGAPLLSALLVLYPLVDAGSVLWQLRTVDAASGPRIPEWINVVVSVLVAIALGWTSVISVAAALAVWGTWAILSGATQLITAVLRRRAGGQVALIVSGGISVFAGTAFLIQGLQGATTIVGVGGYAILGGIFFLIAAIRLSVLLRKGRA
ncbi:hypothetical protein GCM10010988_18140 [Cnuibacter physcomitrellae]|uniref:hypothetical protein n=1 Tax=Cnuibacter physcomitrellae TaxID=1619308 RepID=UPI0019C73A75|nr:hypothetical protein [Cnuibacter physcomitrellae]GGI38267.1 hypothetical protein GCM10010988_18140 [Cnuibacter physcomitrellae]